MAYPFYNPLQIPVIASTPSNPPAGYVLIYAKSDKNIYQLDESGVETNLNLAGGGAGGPQTPNLNVLTANLSMSANNSLVLARKINIGTNKVTVLDGGVLAIL